MTSDSPPTVSILMLTCNNAAKAQQCVFSWLAAAKDEFVIEWLILDNASTDDTPVWLKEFSQRSNKIRTIYSKTNLGCAGGRDVLFKQATGDLLLSLDSDVLLMNRHAVSALADALKDPRIGVVGDHGGGVRPDWTWTNEVPKSFEGEVPLVSGYCQMFRRSALEHVSLDLAYNPYWLEDSDFCFQLRHKLGQVGLVRHVGMRHAWSGTNNGGRPDQLRKWAYFKNKWQEKLGNSVIYAPHPPNFKQNFRLRDRVVPRYFRRRL
jgi:GT2 family glycosyltransferase